MVRSRLTQITQQIWRTAQPVSRLLLTSSRLYVMRMGSTSSKSDLTSCMYLESVKYSGNPFSITVPNSPDKEQTLWGKINFYLMETSLKLLFLIFLGNQTIKVWILGRLIISSLPIQALSSRQRLSRHIVFIRSRLNLGWIWIRKYWRRLTQERQSDVITTELKSLSQVLLVPNLKQNLKTGLRNLARFCLENLCLIFWFFSIIREYFII